MRILKFLPILFLPTFCGAAEKVSTISQYDITWELAESATAGQFVTGDWWVLGPVKVKSVSPEPQAGEAASEEVKSRYGATSMVDDSRMRNGSMVLDELVKGQGYDSRLKNYDGAVSAGYPLELQPGQSLISTVSNPNGEPVQVMHHELMWKNEKSSHLALKSAAILTCVAVEPPADAFRPPYAGADGKFFTLKDIKWDALPKLAPPASTPDFAQFERYLERPWLDHMPTWLLQNLGPSENQVNYGREFSRITSIASLMLMLDEPPAKREKLMIGMVQLGIDLEGMARSGRKWSADGGHWNGRKWPILFAGIVLGQPRFQETAAKTVFSEDQQTYYGKGWAGQTALYQMVNHTGNRAPYEEKPPAEWDQQDKRSESYRIVVSGGLVGTALAAQLMKAKAAWNHDAFFDYYDRWMSVDDPYAKGRGDVKRPKQEGKALDDFVNDMWAQYRSEVPKQPGGDRNRKWVWKGNQGEFVSTTKAN